VNSPSLPDSSIRDSEKSESLSGINDLLPAIESALTAACCFDNGCPERLASAIKYALLAPGKRLRPALVLMAAEACGGTLEAAMPAAVAVEMVHAYSLIHDDLPAMDDDDLRRGQPTVHIKFDEATAILAGDALLANAFSHLAHHIPDPHNALEAVRVLGQAAGPCQLVGGQADDLAAQSNAPWGSPNRTVEHLESIHRRKTGALFSASIDLGAVLVNATQQQRESLSNYAQDIGLAFQVVDDLLDYTANAESLGKRAGKDADRGKLTYPGLLGVDAARDKAIHLIESARCHASEFGTAAWRLTWLANYVLERTH
jgi:geranylgeranyl diphosphate synthase, type II